MTTKTIAAAAFVLLVATAGASWADTMKVTADLKGGTETPPNDTKGSGMLTGTYDPSTKKLTWDVTYSGLTGPATAAHFHGPAPVGKAAGIEIPIKGALASPMKGDATLTDDQAKNLTDGMTYFNIHTAAHKPGEIRGQVMLEK